MGEERFLPIKTAFVAVAAPDESLTRSPIDGWCFYQTKFWKRKLLCNTCCHQPSGANIAWRGSLPALAGAMLSKNRRLWRKQEKVNGYCVCGTRSIMSLKSCQNECTLRLYHIDRVLARPKTARAQMGRGEENRYGAGVFKDSSPDVGRRGK